MDLCGSSFWFVALFVAPDRKPKQADFLSAILGSRNQPALANQAIGTIDRGLFSRVAFQGVRAPRSPNPLTNGAHQTQHPSGRRDDEFAGRKIFDDGFLAMNSGNGRARRDEIEDKIERTKVSKEAASRLRMSSRRYRGPSDGRP